jgi:hypothetical protein
MMEDPNWKDKFDRELQQAEEARARGNEGMARVCARRAAGIAVGEYLRLHQHPAPGPSAYDRLRYLQDLPVVSPGAREAAGYLLTRITVDGELPGEVDLIAEARRMVKELFGSGL